MDWRIEKLRGRQEFQEELKNITPPKMVIKNKMKPQTFLRLKKTNQTKTGMLYER